MTADPLLTEARERDAADPLRSFRDRFELPEGVVYLDGNSLGALPRAAKAVMRDAVERQWGRGLIRGWTDEDWLGAPARVGGKIAPLLGAAADEVIVADSVSVNLFKLLSALVRLAPDRKTVLSEAGNFPTDLHVAGGLAGALGLRLQAAPRGEILERLSGDVAALLLTHVHYRTGERFGMAAVNAAAAESGVPVLWDLSHSAGAVPLALNRDGAEFAVGCGYKYLNGGPGTPAFLYVAADRHSDMRPALRGWLGHADPFGFADDYEPAAGMRRFVVGTPPVLSLLALECGVDTFAGAEMNALWEKSHRLIDFLADAMERRCPAFRPLTPREPGRRGSHISFAHPDAWPINNALIARGVTGDFRTPDALRFGVAPLYTRFEDAARAVIALEEVLRTGEWRDARFARPATVT